MTEHARSTGERRPAKPVGMVDFHTRDTFPEQGKNAHSK